MKKKIAMLLVAVMTMCLVACTGEEEIVEHDHDHAVSANLRIGVSAHDGDIEYEAAEQFAKELEYRSDGAIVATVYGDGQLGSDQELLESMEQDAARVDVVVADLTDLAAYAPNIDISSMPFLFSDYEEARSFMTSDIQAEAASGLGEHNMRALAYYSNGFSCLLTKDYMISAANELQGKTIATSGQTIGTTALKVLGARTMVMDRDAAQQATHQGVCDGYEAPLTQIRENRLYQGYDYLVMTRHTYAASGLVIAESVWQSLDAEYQEILVEAAISSANTNLDNMRQKENQMLSEVESAGVRVHYPKAQTFWGKAESLLRGYEDRYGSLINQIIYWKNEQE